MHGAGICFEAWAMQVKADGSRRHEALTALSVPSARMHTSSMGCPFSSLKGNSSSRRGSIWKRFRNSSSPPAVRVAAVFSGYALAVMTFHLRCSQQSVRCPRQDLRCLHAIPLSLGSLSVRAAVHLWPDDMSRPDDMSLPTTLAEATTPSTRAAHPHSHPERRGTSWATDTPPKCTRREVPLTAAAADVSCIAIRLRGMSLQRHASSRMERWAYKGAAAAHIACARAMPSSVMLALSAACAAVEPGVRSLTLAQGGCAQRVPGFKAQRCGQDHG